LFIKCLKHFYRFKNYPKFLGHMSIQGYSRVIIETQPVIHFHKVRGSFVFFFNLKRSWFDFFFYRYVNLTTTEKCLNKSSLGFIKK
jgi:hypothetical protein